MKNEKKKHESERHLVDNVANKRNFRTRKSLAFVFILIYRKYFSFKFVMKFNNFSVFKSKDKWNFNTNLKKINLNVRNEIEKKCKNYCIKIVRHVRCNKRKAKK